MVVFLWDEECKAQGIPRAGIVAKSVGADGEGSITVVDITNSERKYTGIVDMQVSLMKAAE